MRVADGLTLARGTDPDLVEYAAWRARFEASRGLSRGYSTDAVRETIMRGFRLEIEVESFGEYADEILMSTVQRELAAALEEKSSV